MHTTHTLTLTQARTAVAVASYCEWLNTHDSEVRFTPADFGGPYGLVRPVVNYSDSYDVLVLHARDGGEGGPHTLTCWFHQFVQQHYVDGVAQGQNGLELHAMLQEFDTMLTFAYNEGAMVNAGEAA